MTRPATGYEVLARAQADAKSAETADQLRAALAVTMPLVLGLSLAQTGEAIGKSAAWVGRTRMRYIKGPRKEKLPEKRGGRRHSLIRPDLEVQAVRLAAKRDRLGRRYIAELRKVLIEFLKKDVSRSTAFKMWHRNSGDTIKAEVDKLYWEELALRNPWRNELPKND